VNFSLSWRTESEVLSGAGENSCGNTRCKHHNNQDTATQLTTLELPFAYEEHGERKSALVKVVLCPRCLKKLMWKRNMDKGGPAPTSTEESIERGNKEEGVGGAEDETERSRRSRDGKRSQANGIKDASLLTRHRNSRSRSPKHRKDKPSLRRRRSRSPESQMIDSVSSLVSSAFARLLTRRSYKPDRNLIMMGAGMSVSIRHKRVIPLAIAS